MISHEIEHIMSLDERAAALAAIRPESVVPAQVLLNYYGLSRKENHYALWPDYKGRKVLSIGASGRDFVDLIGKQGADAHSYTGSPHDLPFPSDTFNAVVSDSMLGIMDLDLEVLQASVNEAIRLVKPEIDSVIKFSHFQEEELSTLQKTNQLLLLEDLKSRKDIQVAQIYPRKGMRSRPIEKIGQLIIFKSPITTSLA